MPTFPCPSPASLCDQAPNPSTPYSSESVDGPTFIGISWGQVKPLLGKVFTVYPCQEICESQVSQESASLCSQRAVAGCADICAPVFTNSPQTESLKCEDGNLSYYTSAVGSFSALSQFEADQLASQYAISKVTRNALCISDITIASACKGEFYSGTIWASGNLISLSAAVVSGEIPPGTVLDVSPSKISVSGIAAQVGVFDFQVRASNSEGVFTLRNYSIVVAKCIT